MRFGFTIPTLTAFPRDTERIAGAVSQRYARTYEICALAERLNYDFATIGQHRFSPEVVDASSPLTVLAALAARTTKLRLATNIALMPTHPAVDFAEQCATVDEISGGRLIVGLGIGYRQYEYAGAGLAFADRTGRLEEGIAIMRQAWCNGPVDFAGKHFCVRGVEVMPKPVQEGGPPIWIGAVAEPAVHRAARLADGWLSDNIQTVRDLAPKIARFKKESSAHGNQGTVAMVRKVGVCQTREQVEEEWFPGILRAYQAYVRHNVTFEDKTFEAALASGKPMRLGDFPPDQFIAGTPDECIAQIRDIQEKTRCEYIVADFGRGAHGPEYERLRDMVDLFGREVIPAFA